MKFTKKIAKCFILSAITIVLFANCLFTELILPGSSICLADRDYNAEMEERKALPIQSNEIDGWPDGPAIGAQAAIVMEMNTQTILYAKNIDEKCYPASTTKILTCLLAMQNCEMDEIVTFSHNSIFDVPGDGSKLGGINEGDTMLMEQALYCILVQSANEVASAVGEHVADKLGREKSTAAFAELMNEKAEQLGCKNTHFSNCNGLYDENHYTTAYDLALIGCEFFSNELLCKMSSTPSYHFKLRPEDEEDRWIASKNQLYEGKPYEYSYLLGSKTGYVSQSRQTLVSAAEKNGIKLVCVVFAEETPYQFQDTITLFQYGFENFKGLSISDNESKYKINTMDLFDTENDLFGDSTPLISTEEDTYIVLPNAAEFADAESSLTYNPEKSSNIIATIHYTYSGVTVGSSNILFSKKPTQTSNFPFNFSATDSMNIIQGSQTEENTTTNTQTSSQNHTNFIYINVKLLLLGISIAAIVIIVIILIISIINSYSFSPRGQSSKRRRIRRRENRAARKSAKRSARQQKRRLRKERRRRR